MRATFSGFLHPIAGRGTAQQFRFFVWAVLALQMLIVAPVAAKDPRFGAELVPRNYPSSTYADAVYSMALTANIGGYTSKIWHWGESDALGPVETVVGLARQFGLTSIVQIAPTFLGNPAPPAGYPRTFGDGTVQARYLKDVETLASFHPDYLVLACEVNLMYRFNRSEFDNFRALYQQAYTRAKLVSPSTKVGASFHHLLWYAQRYVDGVDVPAILAPHDFVAFTTYPDTLIDGGFFTSIDAIPPAWYGTTRAAYPTASILFTETGWSSAGTNGLAAQAAFVRNLPRLMSSAKPEAVVWALLQDVNFFQMNLLSPSDLQFLQSLGVDPETLFRKFNGMGLLDSQGVGRPAWDDASRLEFPW
jgi:hypothetical protein